MTRRARKRFLWTGVLLAMVGALSSVPSPAYAGLAALDAFHVGRYHLANGDREKALEAFNDAVRLNPQFVQAYIARGKLYAEMGKFETALADLSYALRIQPTHPEAFAYRGYALLSLGKADEALPEFDMALRLDPSYARVHYLRGQALEVLGETSAAQASLAAAIRLDPSISLTQVTTAGGDGSGPQRVDFAGGAPPANRTPGAFDHGAMQPGERQDAAGKDRTVRFDTHPLLGSIRAPRISQPLKSANPPPQTAYAMPQIRHRRPGEGRPASQAIPDLTSDLDRMAPPTRNGMNGAPSSQTAATPMGAAGAAPKSEVAVEADGKISEPETRSTAPRSATPSPAAIVALPPVADEASDDMPPQEPPKSLPASDILGGKAPETVAAPAKPSAETSEKRLAGALEQARKTLPSLEPPAEPSDEVPLVEAPPVEVSDAGTTDHLAEAEEAYRRGLEFEQMGRATAALVEFEKSLRLNPDDPRVHCRRAHILCESGRTAEALAGFDAAIRLAPGLSTGYYGRGHTKYRAGKLADAVDDFTIALRLDEQHAAALIERGHCFAQLGDQARAAEDRAAALALDPGLAKTGPKYAVESTPKPGAAKALATASDTPSAAAAKVAPPSALAGGTPTGDVAQTLASPSPAAPSAFQSLFTGGRSESAVASVEANSAVTDVRRDDRGSAAGLAMISDDDATPIAEPNSSAVSGGAVSPSRSSTVVLEANPSLVTTAPSNVVELPSESVDGRSGDVGEDAARNEISRLNDQIAKAPADPQLRCRRGALLLETGAAEDALDDLNVAVRLQPDSVEALTLRAKAHLQVDRYPAAQADFDELISLNPNDPVAYSERGYVRLALGMSTEALDDFTTALAMNPEMGEAYCRRALAFALIGDEKKSMADFEEAVKRLPNDAEVFLCRAKAHGEFGDARQALADLNRALELDPNNADAYFERSRLYAERGAYESAQADRMRALRLDPTLR